MGFVYMCAIPWLFNTVGQNKTFASVHGYMLFTRTLPLGLTQSVLKIAA